MNTIDWRNQHVLLTGATGGLGQELARQLTNKGAKVTLVGRNLGKLEALAKSLRQPFLVADVLADDFIDVVSTYMKQQQQEPVTALINNAAITFVGRFETASPEAIENVIYTNLIRPMQLTQLVLPQLPSYGWVLNIGSVFGAIGFPGQTLYNASKFGLRGFTQGLQREREQTEAKVFYCAPRAIATSMNDGLMSMMNRALKTAEDTPEVVARLAIRQIEKGHANSTIGWPEKLLVRLNGILPGIVDGAMKKPRLLLKQLTKGAAS